MNEKERLENLTEIKRLQDLAEERAGKHGHKLGAFRTSQYGDEFVSYTYCGACFDSVVIDSRTESVVSGSALRQRCDPDRIPF